METMSLACTGLTLGEVIVFEVSSHEHSTVQHITLRPRLLSSHSFASLHSIMYIDSRVLQQRLQPQSHGQMRYGLKSHGYQLCLRIA